MKAFVETAIRIFRLLTKVVLHTTRDNDACDDRLLPSTSFIQAYSETKHEMNWESWFCLGTLITLLITLSRNRIPTDAVMVFALTMIVGVGAATRSPNLPDAAQAVAGFGNPGLISIAVLFVVVAGLVKTGAITMARQMIGNPDTVPKALLRLFAPVMGASAFLNNTPVVAMFMPVIDDLCKRTTLSPSRLYLPMAYAATFGGVCTLVGTSTNLIVAGMLKETKNIDLQMFDLAWTGVPCAIAGAAFLILFSEKLLPDRSAAVNIDEDPRQYTVEMLVLPAGPLVGKSVQAAGLRHLQNLYLVEIVRDGQQLAAVSSRQRLEANDRLVFVGVIDGVTELKQIRGLASSADDTRELDVDITKRRLIEAVVSDRCPLVGSSIRDGLFRTTYNAAIVAIARGDQRIPGKIGDVKLLAGDTLLLDTDEDFLKRQRNSSHFHLVSSVDDSAPIRHDRAWIAIAILLVMVVMVASGKLALLPASLVAACLMVTSGCCSLGQARESVDWSLLVVIASALGIAQAITRSGLADTVADNIITLAGGHPWLVLLAVYAITTLFTESITNNAAAALVFPIAVSTAATLNVSVMPFAVCVCVAASAGFATPFAYQTNLMVYGPGGYRFTDYFRIGVPLSLIFMVITVTLTPWIWPF